ncbi:uncharacterized protein LOC119741294 [Patiria miniata]|uniref:Uncharacterized protein n=1 Tax=Patiria miniata TaxID=46514 RepID=A0A914B9V7_PATMI|nr:uncharacterized protein LOC119741294 [Patiria miniata]
MIEQVDILELLAGATDEETTQATQNESGPSNSYSGNPLDKPSGKPKGKTSTKGKRKSNDLVTRYEFETLQNQLTSMANAMEQIQNFILSEPLPKRAKTDPTSDDESDSTLNVSKAVDDLLQNKKQTEQGDSDMAVLQDYEQLYDDGSATGAPINEKLAGLMTKMMRQKLADDKVTEKLKSLERPSNVEALGVTRVNPEVWNTLKPKTRSLDIKMQKAQQSLLAGVVPIVRAIESLMATANAPSASDKLDNARVEINRLLDAVSMIGHANRELNLRRRDLIKPDLNQQFGGLCSAQVPITGLLFGDNLTQKCKDIQETNKLGHKVGQRYRGSTGKPGYGQFQRRRDTRPYQSSMSRGNFRQGALNYKRHNNTNWRDKKFQYAPARQSSAPNK